MKALIIMALSALFAVSPQAAQQKATPEDFVVVSDNTENGVRSISAIPSPLVCTKKIDIQIDARSNKVIKCVFTRGCAGNLNAVSILIQGMTVKEVLEKLDGNPCGKRGTSCTDQLCRVLKQCYKL